MATTSTQLLVWWDSTMTGLASRHPRLAFVINGVKRLGDEMIGRLPSIPGSLPTPKAAFDWIMQQLEAAFPAEAFFLSIVQGLVDAWLSQAGMLPPLPS